MDPDRVLTTKTTTTMAELINLLGLAISMVTVCRITWIPMMTTMAPLIGLMHIPMMLPTVRKQDTLTQLGSTTTTHLTVVKSIS